MALPSDPEPESPVSAQDGATHRPTQHAWPQRFFEAELDKVAISTLPLVLHPRTWIDRRREYVEFLDEQTVRREVRVDMTVPVQRQPLALSGNTTMFYAPVAMVARGSLRQLRVEDGGGNELAPMNRADADKLACRLVVLLARALVSKLEPALEAGLERIVTAERQDEAEDAAPRLGDLKGEAAKQLDALWLHSRFKILLADLTENSLFLIPLTEQAPQQQTCVRYIYEEAYEREQPTGWERVAQRVGWNALDLNFGVPALGSALSCDIDIRAPEELRIESACVYPANPGQQQETTPEPLHLDPHPSRNAHLRVHNAARGTHGFVRVGLRLRSGGFLASSVIAAALTVLVLALGVVRADAVGKATESAAALLIGLPALLAGYLVRPGEHRLVGHVIGGIRQILVGLIILCVVAIGTLIAGAGVEARQLMWLGLGVLAFGAFLVTLATWLRARSLER